MLAALDLLETPPPPTHTILEPKGQQLALFVVPNAVLIFAYSEYHSAVTGVER